jgi:HNH endonuclease
MPCLNCTTNTSNPKFCSRSCAASYNNRSNPKRKLEGSCIVCASPVQKRLIYCQACRTVPVEERRLDLSVNSNAGNNSDIRDDARRQYRNSGRPRFCALCGYDKHVDICHIKDIRTYPDGTLYSIINKQSNLIALCKNHHWEFDHEAM